MKSIPNENVQWLKAHWQDLAKRSYHMGRPFFSNFISVEDLTLAETIAHQVGVNCIGWGGVENAARVMLCFAPFEMQIQIKQFPIICITFRYRMGKKLEHRDFLGALMSSNVERNAVGDILVGERVAQAFVRASVAPVIVQEVHKIGCTGVQVNMDEPVCLEAGTNYITLNGTVVSMRADVLVAFVTKRSREKAVQLIRQGGLQCRHETIESPSAVMQTGDIFSIRGYGKFRVQQMDGITRKGRYHITILKYQ